MVTDQINEVTGKFVIVKWSPLFEGACPPDQYNIYYRDDTLVDWESRHVSGNVSQYDLELKCFNEYELAVTATWGRSRETPLKNSKRWKVKTGKGTAKSIIK